MKKITYIFSLIFILTTACADLEEHPIGIITPESYFNTEGDFEAAVLGLYNSMTDVSVSQDNLYYDILSDEYDVDPGNVRPYRYLFNEYKFTSSDYRDDRIYRVSYTRIAYSNIILSKIDGTDLVEEIKNQYKAEAMFMRAFSYYELIGMYGDVPYLLETLPDPSDGSSLTRTPAEEIYGYLIEDLKWCAENLPDNFGLSRNRATSGTALSLLALVHLNLATYSDVFKDSYNYRTIDVGLVESLTGNFASHWDAASSYALEVINNKSRFGYNLVDDFQDLFNGEIGDTEEHILSVDYYAEAKGPLVAGQTFEGWRNNDNDLTPIRKPLDVGGWSAIVPPLSFYKSFINGDYRKEVSFETVYAITTASVNGDTTSLIHYTGLVDQGLRVPGCAKWSRYPGPTESWPDGKAASYNVALIRYGEILLVAAEALNEINKTEEAIQLINQLRERARNAGGEYRLFPEDIPSGLSKENCWNAIWQERSYELAFEWKRWHDLVRRDSLTTVMGRFIPNKSGVAIGNTVQNHHKLLPIPQSEIDLTSLVQNAGY